MSKVFKKVEYLILGVVCLLALFRPITVQASTSRQANTPPNMSASCSLSIYSMFSGTFTVWKVADMVDQGDGSVVFTLSSGLEGHGVTNETLLDLAGSKSAAPANALAKYLLSSSGSSYSAVYQQEITGGTTTKLNYSFAPGLYLVACKVDSGINMMMSPTLISLPSINEENNWYYDVEMDATKFEETVEHSVKKVWDDNNDAYHKRPASIQVTIIGNPEPVDKTREMVTLSAANDWKYTWTDLPKYWAGEEVQYTVMEKEVANYEADQDLDKDDKTLTILTNTYKPTKPSTETPSTDKPKKPGNTPKTGDTNNILLYVVLLVVAAAGIGIGVGVKRKKKN